MSRRCGENITDSRERGASLVELLVATTVGLALAALCGQTFAAYHGAYRSAVTRIDHTQQADFALALMSAELESRIDVSQSLGCPPLGLELAEGRIEFAANLFDRETVIASTVAAGTWEAIVESAREFESGDTVRITDVGAVGDPSDDRSQCVRIASISGNHLILGSALARPFPTNSPVILINRVLYRLDDRGRVMRTQDSGTQRIADNIRGFDVVLEGRLLTLRLAMRDGSTRTRGLVVERHP
jgi:hypothetical protein